MVSLILLKTVTGDTLVLSATSANDATRLWLKDASLHQPTKTAHVIEEDSPKEWDEDMEGEEDEEGGDDEVTAPVLAGKNLKRGSLGSFVFLSCEVL